MPQTPLILDGKVVRDAIAETLSRKIKASGPAALAIVQVGDRPDSTSYINQKKKFGEKIGAVVQHEKFAETATEAEILAAIRNFNDDPSIHGIIVQLPLPEGLSAHTIIEAIDPKKDVDGLSAYNLKLLMGEGGGLVPATARGVLSLLDYYKIPVSGKRVVIVGRSLLVGKPLFFSLLARDATVTLCHSKTPELAEETKRADILVSAAGKARLIGKDHVRSEQVVVDVGINMASGESLEEEIPGTAMVGDVDFEAVGSIVSAISPVPGGVGPMTVASLFENLLEAYEKSRA